MHHTLMEAIATLPSREAKVLMLLFGLEDGRSRTLEEVGKEFGVTRERIRQVEAKALRKLRQPKHSGRLLEALTGVTREERMAERAEARAEAYAEAKTEPKPVPEPRPARIVWRLDPEGYGGPDEHYREAWERLYGGG